MGTYRVTVPDFVEVFEEFLRNIEGDVSAECVAESWNLIAERQCWTDRLSASFPGPESNINNLKSQILQSQINIKVKHFTAQIDADGCLKIAAVTDLAVTR